MCRDWRNRARQGTVGSESKSDPRDARVIADQVRTRADLRPVAAESELDIELRLLNWTRHTVHPAVALDKFQAGYAGYGSTVAFNRLYVYAHSRSPALI
jgi:hypothetical protein